MKTYLKKVNELQKSITVLIDETQSFEVRSDLIGIRHQLNGLQVMEGFERKKIIRIKNQIG